MRHRVLLALIMLVAAGTVLAADTTVSIREGQFAPRRVRIKVGDTVTFRNDDDRDHRVQSDDFDSGNLKAGQSYDRRFTRKGTYPYRCARHPRETGSVVVE